MPLAPCVMVKLVGDAETVKFGGGFTVNEIVVVLVKLADVPVMVIVNVPVAAELVAETVNGLVLAVLVGLKVAVTPLGRPDADKLTLLLKPFCGVTVMVIEPLAPCTMVKLFGEAESV